MTSKDAGLARRLADGDESAFDELYSRYHDPLCRFLTRIVGDPARAAELCQETFLKVHRTLVGGQEVRNLQAWLFRVGSREALKVLRRRRLRERLAHLFRRQAAGFEAQVAEQDRVSSALGALPESQRLPVILHVYHGFTYAEIAGVLGTSETAIKLRMMRAKDRLRELLDS